MKKVYIYITCVMMVVIGFVSCASSSSKTVEGEETTDIIDENPQYFTFSSKTIEGYWWRNWGIDGYDYVYFKPNGKCDYDFGFGENKDCSYSIDSIHEIVTIYRHGYEIEKNLIYEKEDDYLTEVGSIENYSMARTSEEELKEYEENWSPAFEEP